MGSRKKRVAIYSTGILKIMTLFLNYAFLMIMVVQIAFNGVID